MLIMPQLQNNNFCFVSHVFPKHHDKPVKVSHTLWLASSGVYKLKLHLTQSHALHTNDESLDDLSLRGSYWISEKDESWLYFQNQKYKEGKK